MAIPAGVRSALVARLRVWCVRLRAPVLDLRRGRHVIRECVRFIADASISGYPQRGNSISSIVERVRSVFEKQWILEDLMISPDISAVIPCYNEEENAEAICAAVIGQLEAVDVTFDVIFIDNDSTDRTVEVIKGICARDSRVRLIVNSRNFGQMRSPTYAVYQADGRAIIGLSADFQDPPEMIPEFIERWRAGADIVLGVSTLEKVGFVHGKLRQLSYWLARNFSDYRIVPQATGFGLYTARVVDATRHLSEPEPFFRAMLVETGFRLETISYRRPSRAAGQSKNDFSALFGFAISALAGSSKKLLRVPMYVGAFGLLMSLLLLIGGIVAFFSGWPTVGWFIAAIVQFEIALMFGFLGLLGDNIRIISERTRRTPLVIERERVNFPVDSDT